MIGAARPVDETWHSGNDAPQNPNWGGQSGREHGTSLFRVSTRVVQKYTFVSKSREDPLNLLTIIFAASTEALL